MQATIIDANGNGSVVSFKNGETADSVIFGLTITGGYPPGYPGKGGGIFIEAASPTISNCIIPDNSAYYGGGIYCGANSNPEIINCTIGGNYGSFGGGFYCDADGNSTIIECTFSGNSAFYYGGGIFCGKNSDATITNCTIRTNSTSGGSFGSGGGITCGINSSVSIATCTIFENSTHHDGAGIYCNSSNVTISNCIISRNSANSIRGGGISSHGYYTNPTITNSTLSKNSADYGGGIFCYYHSSTTVHNCIFWPDSGSNGPEIALLSTSQPATLPVYNSDIQGGSGAAYVESGCTLSWGTANIDSDPLFVNTTEGDLHLKSTSPCIDMGNNGLVPVQLTTDIDGDNRIIDGDLDTTATVDMGADEYRPDLESNPRPTLDPMAMQYVGVHEVNGVPTIRLCAAETSIPGQPGGDVEYMFDSPTGAFRGPSSGWRSGSAFDAAPVVEGTLYTYHVKARNAADPAAETSWSETATTSTIIGDLDDDMAVDFRDYAPFSSHWQNTGCNDPNWCGKADFDKSGDVNWPDLKIFSNHWLE